MSSSGMSSSQLLDEKGEPAADRRQAVPSWYLTASPLAAARHGPHRVGPADAGAGPGAPDVGRTAAGTGLKGADTTGDDDDAGLDEVEGDGSGASADAGRASAPASGGAGAGGGAVGGAVAAKAARVPPVVVPTDVLEHTKTVSARLGGYTGGKLAAFAWVSVLSHQAVTTTPTAQEAWALVGATVGFTLVIWGLLFVILYLTRTVAAYEALRDEAAAMVRSSAEADAAAAGAGAGRKGGDASKPAVKKAVRALSSAVGGGGRFRVRVLEEALLRYGDAAGFSVAALWFGTLNTLLPVPTTGSEGVDNVLPWVWLLAMLVAMALLLVSLDEMVFVFVRSHAARRTWAFGDIGALKKAFQHDVGGAREQQAKVGAAVLRQHVDSTDYVLTEVEKSVAWLLGFQFYSAIATSIGRALELSAIDAAWLAVGIVAAVATLVFTVHRCMAQRRHARRARATSPDASLASFHLPAWMVPNSNAARHLSETVRARPDPSYGTGGAAAPATSTSGDPMDALAPQPSCSVRVARVCARLRSATGSLRHKVRDLSAASIVWMCILCFNGALKASVNPNLKPTGGPATGTDRAGDDALLALAVIASVVAATVAFERGSVWWVGGKETRDEIKAVARKIAAAQGGGAGTVDGTATPATAAAGRSFRVTEATLEQLRQLRLSYDVRAAYLRHMHRIFNEAMSLLAALTVNQVVLDIVAKEKNSSAGAYGYAFLMTGLAVALEATLARWTVNREAAAAARARAAQATRDAAAAGGSGTSSAAKAGDGEAEAAPAWKALMDAPLESISDLETAKALISATRELLVQTDGRVSQLRARLVAVASA